MVLYSSGVHYSEKNQLGILADKIFNFLSNTQTLP